MYETFQSLITYMCCLTRSPTHSWWKTVKSPNSLSAMASYWSHTMEGMKGPVKVPRFSSPPASSICSPVTPVPSLIATPRGCTASIWGNAGIEALKKLAYWKFSVAFDPSSDWPDKIVWAPPVQQGRRERRLINPLRCNNMARSTMASFDLERRVRIKAFKAGSGPWRLVLLFVSLLSLSALVVLA